MKYSPLAKLKRIFFVLTRNALKNYRNVKESIFQYQESHLDVSETNYTLKTL